MKARDFLLNVVRPNLAEHPMDERHAFNTAASIDALAGLIFTESGAASIGFPTDGEYRTSLAKRSQAFRVATDVAHVQKHGTLRAVTRGLDRVVTSHGAVRSGSVAGTDNVLWMLGGMPGVEFSLSLREVYLHATDGSRREVKGILAEAVEFMEQELTATGL